MRETCKVFISVIMLTFFVPPSREMWNIHCQYETSVSFKNLSQPLLHCHSKNSCILYVSTTVHCQVFSKAIVYFDALLK